DGFGVGWYESEPDPELGAAPCIFTSVTPAWNNMNLIRLAEKIKSPLVFAHVRASTAGSVSESNCHPWQYGRLMFMHNGHIADFHLIKRKIQESLPDPIFLNVNGNTDSEWAFAVFLSQLESPLQAEPFCHVKLKEAMFKTIQKLNQWAKDAGIHEASMLNFAVTDGCSVVCSRYISSRTLEAASLYYSSGTKFGSFQPGHYKMVKADRREDIVLIASEPLTFEKADWLKIPTNTVVVVTARMNVLMYPVLDEFQNCSSDAGKTMARAEEHSAPVVAVLKGDGRGEDGARKPLAEREVVFVEDKRPPLSVNTFLNPTTPDTEMTGVTPSLSFGSLPDVDGVAREGTGLAISPTESMSSSSSSLPSLSQFSTSSSSVSSSAMMMMDDDPHLLLQHRPNNKRKYPYSVGPSKTLSPSIGGAARGEDDCGNGSDDEIEEDFKIFSHHRRQRLSAFSHQSTITNDDKRIGTDDYSQPQ
ncbi:hypothetical protein BGZ83_001623, partial [Gryganskiella cystojenkinii]